MKRLPGLIGALVVVLAPLSGCGGDDQKKTDAGTGLTLLEVCHVIGSELPNADQRGSDAWTSYSTKLASLKTDSALARQAIQDMTPATARYAATPGPGADFLDARSALRAAVAKVARTCIAAGSKDFR